MTVTSVYLDSNVPMYAAGEAHALREPAIALLQAIADDTLTAVTGVEVLQEILYRYRHIGYPAKGFALFDTFGQYMAGHILPTTIEALVFARQLMDEVPQLDARDAVHAGVMKNNGINAIISADRAFDLIRDVQWIPLHEWERALHR